MEVQYEPDGQPDSRRGVIGMTFFYALIIEYALQGHTLQARMYLESSKACSDALRAAEALSDAMPAEDRMKNREIQPAKSSSNLGE